MIDVMRVLVVDDDPMQLALVERALPPEWFTVRCVGTTADMVAAGPQFAPQVVLVDVNMPDTSADQTVALARKAAPGALVVLYSAWEDSKLRSLAMRLGADTFISKSESVVGIGRRLRELYKG